MLMNKGLKGEMVMWLRLLRRGFAKENPRSGDASRLRAERPFRKVFL
ncbi:MAG: hypothetical protein ACI4QA_05920 [Candidatus Spyradosoma sp.]